MGKKSEERKILRDLLRGEKPVKQDALATATHAKLIEAATPMVDRTQTRTNENHLRMIDVATTTAMPEKFQTLMFESLSECVKSNIRITEGATISPAFLEAEAKVEKLKKK